MSDQVVALTAARIAEHATAHGLQEIDVILHGGEPLLAGRSLIEKIVTTIRSAAAPHTRVHVSVQTNGTLLTRRFLDLFAELDIGIGVSLDGDQTAQDRHRRRPGGGGSYDLVAASLTTLISDERLRPLFRGLLCAIDLDNDPLTTYEALLKFEPPALSLLLPHGNWHTPPPGITPGPGRGTPYADWLIPVFDRWYHAPRRETRIRLFEEIIQLVLGGASTSEEIGLSPVAVVVVETDGSIEQSDILKSAYEGAPYTGLHLSRDSFADVLRHPGMAARQIGGRALSDTCRACDLHPVCGAGLYAHRYRPGTGFRNPSIYCEDLYRLIAHIQATVTRHIQARTQQKQQSVSLGGDEIR